MIFSELYSAYYNAVAGILSDILRGETNEKELQKTVVRYAFSESITTILPSLKNEKWQLLNKDMTTPIKNIPSMPLTLLEKRWLKAISNDPRIGLFNISFDGLEDIEPLFTSEDYFIYDKYADGDPYFDEGYIRRFRAILGAIRKCQPLKLEIVSRKGRLIRMNVLPKMLEYSEKDDKFRLLASGRKRHCTINLANIVTCEKYDTNAFIPAAKTSERKKIVTLKIVDERNALERCMLHFAHFEKQTERIDEKNYIVRIKYNVNDETEMVIRILGFGPLTEVIEPKDFKNLIADRLKRQKSCGLF